MLRTKNRLQAAIVSRQLVGGVGKPVIHRRWVADDSDSPASERSSGQQSFGSKLYAHAAIISQGFRGLWRASPARGVGRKRTIVARPSWTATRLRPSACLSSGALIDYAPLVVSTACFARAESRSSLELRLVPPSTLLQSRRAATAVCTWSVQRVV